MTASSFRLNSPITVIALEENHDRLKQLPEGSVLQAAALTPDPNHMIECTCDGDTLLVFSRDLRDSAELLVAAEIQSLAMSLDADLTAPMPDLVTLPL